MPFEWIIDSQEGVIGDGRGGQLHVPEHGFAFRWDSGAQQIVLHVKTGKTAPGVCDYSPPLSVEQVDKMMDVLWRFRLEAMGVNT